MLLHGRYWHGISAIFLMLLIFDRTELVTVCYTKDLFFVFLNFLNKSRALFIYFFEINKKKTKELRALFVAVTRSYVWAYASFQFALVILFSYVYYDMVSTNMASV